MVIRIINYIKNNWKWLLLLFLICFSIFLWYVIIKENRNGILKVVFLNVGQGNATYIESPNGTQIIIDGGPNKNLTKEISAITPFYDRHIDMLIVSHPDRDHYEGFISLLDKYSASVFMESGISDTSSEYNYLKQKISSKKIPDILARKGEVIDIGGGAYIEILFPDRDVSRLESNSGSIIAKLIYGDTSFIVEGDAPQAIENYLVDSDAENLKSNVIDLGHHGSKTSSSLKYLSLVSPEYAVVSAGKDNSYNHPNPETLDTLNNLQIKTLATCTNGRIVFESDGKNLVLKNKKIQPVSAGCK